LPKEKRKELLTYVKQGKHDRLETTPVVLNRDMNSDSFTEYTPSQLFADGSTDRERKLGALLIVDNSKDKLINYLQREESLDEPRILKYDRPS
jgi:hypothetical protein